MLQLAQQFITYKILLVLIIQSNISYAYQLQLWLYMSAIIALIYKYHVDAGDEDDGVGNIKRERMMDMKV